MAVSNGGHQSRVKPALNPANPYSQQAISAGSTRRALLFLVLIFSASALSMLYLYNSFPQLTEEEQQDLKLPRNMDDAKRLGRLLSIYRDQYYLHVLLGVFVTYIFLQTFAIPGSIFLSILTGFLFPFWLSLLLVCFCSAVGASLCYMLSLMAGKPLLLRFCPQRAQHWADKVSEHRDNLLNYIIFLRITPFLPNWFINIASPVLGVPLMPFFVGTFFGVAPPSFVAVQAGTTLYQLTKSSDAVSWTALFWLLVFAIISLVPVLFKRRLKQRFD